MAIGGAMKGHLHNNGSRGRSYGLMLLLAFGIAIFGVMVIHKLRERRIFNLLVKEKDRELITLHLLLQKEREYGKEAKLKLEEMKAKMHTLRIQKTDLNSRILEMQSTISSLKDEQRTIELALEEKQNEIKQLRENSVDPNNEYNQAKALSEILKQKEAEIEDLKNHLELPVKVWSVSTDDPANSSVNSTAKAGTVSRDQTKFNESKEESGKIQESSNGELRNNSTQDADIRQNESANINMNEESVTEDHDNGDNEQVIAERSEMTGVQSKRLEDSQEGGLGHGSTENEGMTTQDSRNGKLFGVEEKQNSGYNSKVIHNYGREVQKAGDEDHGVKLETTADDQPGSNSNSEVGDNQELGVNHKGGMKLEKTENLHGGGYMFRGRGKRGYGRKLRGKRWRITAKSREINESSRSDGLAGTRNTVFVKSTFESERDRRPRDKKPESFDQEKYLGIDSSRRNQSASVYHNSTAYDKLPQGEGLKLKIDGLEHVKGKETLAENRSDDNRNDIEDSPQGTTSNMHEKLEDADDMRHEVTNNSRNSQISVEQVPPDITLSNENNNGTSKEARQQNPSDTENPEKQATVQPHAHRTDVDKTDISGEAVDDKDKDLDDPEMEDTQETETETDTARESKSNLEESGEENQQQHNEPEF